MSSDVAIQTDCLSKCYLIYDKPHYRLLQMIWRGKRQYYREFWAVQDVSLTVGRGETVGIIGKNGSGKSTLLKMICGTLNPTRGSYATKGRIAAILELGSGFNPDFTGRENVYMKASILGLTSEEIDARFQSIADFAEIGEFMEQPTRTYSSGMMVRLAFAVSVNVDPEILVIDEALAVGDEKFQRKCFARIEQIKEKGATILFVSHSGASVVQLCDRAVLMDHGELLAVGLPKEIYGRYQQLLYAPDENRAVVRDEIRQLSRQSVAGTRKIEQPSPPAAKDAKDAVKPKKVVVAVSEDRYDPNMVPTSTISYEGTDAVIGKPMILSGNGERVNHLVRGKRYRYVYCVEFKREVFYVRFGMLIKTKLGVELGGAVSSPDRNSSLQRVKQGETYRVEFDFHCCLNTGDYFLNAGVLGCLNESGAEQYLHRTLDAAMFKVQPERNNTSTAIVDFDCRTRVLAE